MKKFLPALIVLLILLNACKKDPTPKTDPNATNVDIIITTESTYDLKIQQRANTTLTWFTPVNQPGTKGNFSYKLRGETKDLIWVTVNNTGALPVRIQILYNGRALRDDQSGPEHFNGTTDAYIP